MSTYSTRSLLQCAAIAAASAVGLVLMTPLTSWLAVLSAPVYAAVASLHMLGPMIALRWTRLPWAASLTAFLAALIAMPFSTLGALLVPALVLPALAIDVVVLLARPRGGWLGLYVGALCGGLVIFAISFVVIPADVVGPALIVTLLVVRLGSYAAVMRLAQSVATGLVRAGVRPSTASRPDRVRRGS
ncbi:hypothetical protein CLV49_2105 [Labedella gwakjiensis]|uniref:Energy-coupling factor transport system substrate-specific component n=2 Tax=Labedella gwakjiensis TaxID=390269 RepID=A0A2P8GWY8_9MICO|nr:hypothetical protein CLV49_2105 [Labedella gwakjiensis]RUQ87000.1 hypothetical protein ELQ93_08690 [Labedella gwakjiensis]